ncbi:hypothetical protein [Lysinibacillus fusiformis]|uniref:hypothetical protein n=1 Tax=Lysinibacillus fusiformis TaxID=28031 RepID=UPI0023A9AB68|nr:hypothetical protein [Lysinibacillus fusiformis]WEA41185.1 hypothetical protein PWJ66_09680 [Lysinibacillus fusiformis]
MFKDNEGTLKFLAILSLASFGGLFFISNTPLKNDIEVASLYGNKCIKERNGAILQEDHSLIIKYTMESEQFDIFCYNEMITDMNSQNVSNIWETRYADSSIVRWNEKEYVFTRPDKRFVITDANVSTLLKENRN